MACSDQLELGSTNLSITPCSTHAREVFYSPKKLSLCSVSKILNHRHWKASLLLQASGLQFLHRMTGTLSRARLSFRQLIISELVTVDWRTRKEEYVEPLVQSSDMILIHSF